jgi:hypothetical protein
MGRDIIVSKDLEMTILVMPYSTCFILSEWTEQKKAFDLLGLCNSYEE